MPGTFRLIFGRIRCAGDKASFDIRIARRPWSLPMRMPVHSFISLYTDHEHCFVSLIRTGDTRTGSSITLALEPDITTGLCSYDDHVHHCPYRISAYGIGHFAAYNSEDIAPFNSEYIAPSAGILPPASANRILHQREYRLFHQQVHRLLRQRAYRLLHQLKKPLT